MVTTIKKKFKMDKKIKLISFRPSKDSNLIEELSRLAKADNRKLNNYIENVLVNHVREVSKSIVVIKNNS
jgi:hypothetical protein